MESRIETRPVNLFNNSKESSNSTVFSSADKAKSKDRRNHSLTARAETLKTTDILDEIAPDWCYAIKDIRMFGDIVTVTASVTINGITREGLGSSNAENGKGFSFAEEFALKEAASKFKFRNKLKQSSSRNNKAENRSFRPEPNYLFNPVAQNLSDQITSKQLRMIKDFGRETGLNTYNECSKMMRCNVTELSRLAASRFIEHLQGISRQTQMPDLQHACFTA